MNIWTRKLLSRSGGKICILWKCAQIGERDNNMH